LKVVEAMDKDVAVVDVAASVAEAARIMRDKLKGCVIVLGKGKPVGIITERDVTYKTAAEGIDPDEITTESVMSTPLITVDPEADLIEASKLMSEHKIRRLVVTGHDILYGILSAIDIARHLERYVEGEVQKIIRGAFFLSTGFR